MSKNKKRKRKGFFKRKAKFSRSPRKQSATSHEGGASKSDERFDKEATFYSLRSGSGFALCKDGSEYFVPEFCTNTAMHNDEIAIVPLKNTPKNPFKKGSKKEACVSRIKKRAKKFFTGTVERDLQTLYFKPSDTKLPQKMRFDDESVNSLELKDKVYVKFVSWSKPEKEPLVKLEKILGKSGEYKAESDAILLEYGFKREFPEKVNLYAEKLRALCESNKDDYKEREDFRDKITFTIDPDDAKDFDDALSVHKKEDGYEVGVHIADVTHYVKYGDPVDTEAQKRANSVYLVGATVPMLPEVLSNDLCSLNPDEEKRTFSVIFDFDKDFNLKDYRFAKTLIRSNHRFTYKEAQAVLDKKAGLFFEELQILKRISDKERRGRERAGALDFESQELDIRLDDTGRVAHLSLKERLDSMKLVEDLMLLTNKTVASYMQEQVKDKKVGIFIFRVHEEPDPDKIAELAQFLSFAGLDFYFEGSLPSVKDLSDMLKRAKESPLRASIEQATLRSLAKAVYSHKNIGHYSLSFKNYAHFTSPIRRYPDVMVHRLLYANLQGEQLPKNELEHYRKLAEHCSNKEVQAMRAERDSVSLKQAEYMSQFVGTEFECVISGITKNGLFLYERYTLAEGFAPFSRASKYLYFDEVSRSAVLPNKSRIQIGDSVKARLTKSDPEEKRLEWEILI